MARITVHLHGTLAAQTGVNARCCEVDITDGATLRRVFELIAERYGKKFLETVVDSATGELQPHLHVLVNGESVQRLEGIDTLVQSKDRIVIMVEILSAMGGG